MKKLAGKKLTNELDRLIRDILHYKFPQPVCFVCGRHDNWFHPQYFPKGIQVGHYITRSIHILRWDFKNIAPQCSACNRIHEENTLPFTMKIIESHGVERFNYLNDKYKTFHNLGKSMSQAEKLKLYAELNSLVASLQSV